jgi:uncharacterized repeat protein (TIGR03803 family)
MKVFAVLPRQIVMAATAAVSVGLSLLSAPASAQISTTYSFQNPPSSRVPIGKLMKASNGLLYGTTYNGGTSDRGTVFCYDPANTNGCNGSNFQTLISFTGSNGLDPTAGLMQASNGKLYGTTFRGGTSGGYGTVFQLNADGTGFQTLKSFSGSDGAGPDTGELIQATNGKLYGTTNYGGTSGGGTVFQLNVDGTGFQTLKSFSGSDGGGLTSGLIHASNGKLYGTTYYGGTFGRGTVFQLNADGTSFQSLHSFNDSNGGYPYGTLMQASNGKLYGTTIYGGTSGVGTVFQLNIDGTGFQSLHSFNYSNGGYPRAGLLQASNGRLYGTTYYGGTSGAGTIFLLNGDGTGFQSLHSFNGSNGAYPQAGLVETSNGRLHGTTNYGGTSGNGTIFQVLFPTFGSMTPAQGPVGTSVVISGTNFTSTTSVTFNGIPATFSVNASGTQITTTVPVGATTGRVVITNPGGSATSPRSFRVMP